jgi:hypothetical protein
MGFTNAGRVLFEPIREVVFGDIGADYSQFGTPYLNQIRIIRIINTSNADVFISFDGTNDDIIVPSDGFVLYDYGANANFPAGILAQSKNTQVWIKLVSADATSGSVYLETVYAAGANG